MRCPADRAGACASLDNVGFPLTVRQPHRTAKRTGQSVEDESPVNTATNDIK